MPKLGPIGLSIAQDGGRQILRRAWRDRCFYPLSALFVAMLAVALPQMSVQVCPLLLLVMLGAAAVAIVGGSSTTTISIEGGVIRAVHEPVGIAGSTEALTGSLERIVITPETDAGSRKVATYAVHAIGRHGEHTLLAPRIAALGQAERIKGQLERTLGLAGVEAAAQSRVSQPMPHAAWALLRRSLLAQAWSPRFDDAIGAIRAYPQRNEL